MLMLIALLVALGVSAPPAAAIDLVQPLAQRIAGAGWIVVGTCERVDRQSVFGTWEKGHLAIDSVLVGPVPKGWRRGIQCELDSSTAVVLRNTGKRAIWFLGPVRQWVTRVPFGYEPLPVGTVEECDRAIDQLNATPRSSRVAALESAVLVLRRAAPLEGSHKLIQPEVPAGAAAPGSGK
jgi:hypothetical protein